MTPIKFNEATTTFGAPTDLSESQCSKIPAYIGTVEKGSVEGSPIIVTAWKPNSAELEVLQAGGSVFVSFLSSGLPPHLLTTSFPESINLA